MRSTRECAPASDSGFRGSGEPTPRRLAPAKGAELWCRSRFCWVARLNSGAAAIMISVAILQRFIVHRRGISKASIYLLWPPQLHVARYVGAVAISYIKPLPDRRAWMPERYPAGARLSRRDSARTPTACPEGNRAVGYHRR